MKLSGTVCERKESSLLLQTCRRILEYFLRAHRLPPKALQHSQVRRTPNGFLEIRKALACGLELVAESSDPKTATLRIFFDPPRFNRWREQQGEITLFYSNPYGIEIAFQAGVWGIFVDEKRLGLRVRDEQPYEVARLQLKGPPDALEVALYLPEGAPHEVSQLCDSLPVGDSSLSTPAVLQPDRVLRVPEPEGEDVARLLSQANGNPP
jgi:hypothetical protein